MTLLPPAASNSLVPPLSTVTGKKEKEGLPVIEICPVIRKELLKQTRLEVPKRFP
jgi:hypothetical protein